MIRSTRAEDATAILALANAAIGFELRCEARQSDLSETASRLESIR